MTLDEASWLVTVPEVGNMFSALPAGLLADRFGRKRVLLVTTPLMIIGWGIILYFKSFLALVVARLIQSLSIGIVFTVCPMYLGEIAYPKYRGAISGVFTLFWWFGYPYEFILGTLLQYTTFTYVTASTSLVFFAAFIWQPESPYFYLLKNDLEKAKQSLSWFNCTTEIATNQELERMKQSLDENQTNKMSVKELISTPTNRKAIVILMLVGFLRVFCGLVPLLSYSTETLMLAGDYFFLAPNTVTILVGVFIVVGSFGSLFTIDFLGRITLLVISCSISGFMMFSIGTYYFLKTFHSIDVASFSWIPPVCLMIFCVVGSIGIFPVSVVYTSELFDSHTRASASSFMTFYTMFLGFLVLKLYFTFIGWFGLYINFYIYALTCFLGVLFSLCLFPETKGKTFEQIRIELCKDIA